MKTNHLIINLFTNIASASFFLPIFDRACSIRWTPRPQGPNPQDPRETSDPQTLDPKPSKYM